MHFQSKRRRGLDNDRLCFPALVLVNYIGHDDTYYVQSPPPAISYGQYKLPSYSAITNLANSFRSRFNACHIRTSIITVGYIFAQTKDNKSIFVKFTGHYAVELHDFCAQRQMSPRFWMTSQGAGFVLRAKVNELFDWAGRTREALYPMD